MTVAMAKKSSGSDMQGRSKYQFINIVAKRARQLNEGDLPTLPAENLEPLDLAVKELGADKLRVTETSEEEESDDEEE